MPTTFYHDDAGYQNWIDSHQHGFAVNCYRNLNPGYLMLHRARCGTISGTPARGATWTDGEFIKVCSVAIQELEQMGEARGEWDVAAVPPVQSGIIVNTIPVVAPSERSMGDDSVSEIQAVAPGEILAEEFLAGYGLTEAALARALGVSPNCIAEIVHNRRRISADTALRLGLFFDTTTEFWQNLQAHYDMKMARRALSPEMAESIAV